MPPIVQSETERGKFEAKVREAGSRVHHENTLEASVDWLYRMLEKRQSVSETIAMKPDGSLNPESTPDLARPMLVNSVAAMELTTNGLMKACREIADKHPDLEFSFKVDDNKHTLTYTVTRRVEGGITINVGDYAQWIASGAEQWIEPRRITGFSDDKKFAFAGDSPTGIPVTQLEKRQPESV